MARAALLPALSGLLLALSHAPFPTTLLPFVALVPAALYCARLPDDKAGALHAARGGFGLGVAFFGVLLFWVAFSIPGAPLLGTSAYLSGVALMALAPALATWLLHASVHARAPLWLGLPLAWTTSEWLRGSLPGGLALPWAGTALTLAGAPRALGLLPWVGENGVTLWVAAVNGLIASAALGRGAAVRRRGADTAMAGRTSTGWRAPALAALVLAGGPFLLPAPEGGNRVGPALRVVLLQTAVPVEVRRDPAVGAADMTDALDRLLASVEPGAADVVVLPETAIPLRLVAPEGRPFLDRLQSQAARLDATLLVGAFGIAPGPAPRAYNSLFVVNAAGITARYDKRRLVPLIERTPLAGSWLLGALGDTTSYAVGEPAPPLQVGVARVAPLICFESAFAGLVRAQRRRGATLLVNVTNDAWFGGGFPGRAARAQHEAHLVLRAVESGAPVVRVANGGRSGLVDARGLSPVAPAGAEGVQTLSVPLAGPLPLAVWLGGWVGPLAALGILGVLLRARLSGRAEAP